MKRCDFFFFFFWVMRQSFAGIPASDCEERESCWFPPEMKRKMAGEDNSVQSAVPSRPCRSLLMNLAIIKGEGSAERGFRWGTRMRDWWVGWPVFGAEWLEGNKTLVEQPRPDNLIPIIGIPGEFLVLLRAEQRQVETRQKSVFSYP